MSGEERRKTQYIGVEAIVDEPPAIDAKAVEIAKAEEAALQDAALKEKRSLQDQLTVQEIKTRKQDRKERLKYASRVFWLIVCWVAVVGAIVLVQGMGFQGFELSDPVMIAILSGTTASVISIFLIVANYLFPRAPRPKA